MTIAPPAGDALRPRRRRRWPARASIALSLCALGGLLLAQGHGQTLVALKTAPTISRAAFVENERLPPMVAFASGGARSKSRALSGALARGNGRAKGHADLRRSADGRAVFSRHHRRGESGFGASRACLSNWRPNRPSLTKRSFARRARSFMRRRVGLSNGPMSRFPARTASVPASGSGSRGWRGSMSPGLPAARADRRSIRSRSAVCSTASHRPRRASKPASAKS